MSVLLVAVCIGVAIGRHLERDAQLRRSRDELRRRCSALGGSCVTTSDDGGVW